MTFVNYKIKYISTVFQKIKTFTNLIAIIEILKKSSNINLKFV